MEEQNKMTIELSFDDKSRFNIDEAINLAWEELKKCAVVDVVYRGSRTKFGDL